MAIFHLNAKLISRSAGRSATAAAAYRAGERLTDERTGRVFDYAKKRDVSYKTVIAPPNSPAWASVREALWNACESAEKRKDAQVAREVEVALPRELGRAEQIRLVQRFVREQFVARGMVADIALHSKLGNPHAHILLTTRLLDRDGFKSKARDWNSVDQLNGWRAAWEESCNRGLQKAGRDERVDHRTLAAQGIDRDPGNHLGPAAVAIDRATGKSTRMADHIKTKEKEMNEAIDLLRRTAAERPGSGTPRVGLPDCISVCDGQAHPEYRRVLFEREYVRGLVTAFSARCIAIQEVNTPSGLCHRLELASGAVRDYGNRVVLETNSDLEVRLAIDLARHKGWKTIHLTGSATFREAAFMEAVASGLYNSAQITGYTPTPANRQAVLELAKAKPPPAEFTITRSHFERGEQSATGQGSSRKTPNANEGRRFMSDT